MPNPIVHFEIPADDVQRATKFYEQALGWKISDPWNMDYLLVETKDGDTGINGGLMPRRNPGQPFMNYIQVDSPQNICWGTPWQKSPPPEAPSPSPKPKSDRAGASSPPGHFRKRRNQKPLPSSQRDQQGAVTLHALQRAQKFRKCQKDTEGNLLGFHQSPKRLPPDRHQIGCPTSGFSDVGKNSPHIGCHSAPRLLNRCHPERTDVILSPTL